LLLSIGYGDGAQDISVYVSMIRIRLVVLHDVQRVLGEQGRERALDCEFLDGAVKSWK
jgi:hypothetical protein